MKYPPLNFRLSLSSTCFSFQCQPCFYTAGHNKRSWASVARQGVVPLPSGLASPEHPFSRTQISLLHFSLTQKSQAETRSRCSPFLANPLRGTAAGPRPPRHPNSAELAVLTTPHRAATIPKICEETPGFPTPRAAVLLLRRVPFCADAAARGASGLIWGKAALGLPAMVGWGFFSAEESLSVKNYSASFGLSVFFM